jgi:hypothetical protein
MSVKFVVLVADANKNLSVWHVDEYSLCPKKNVILEILG